MPLRPGHATGDRPTDPEVRTRQIREGVPTATRNHIDNLVDEVELVEQHEARGGRSSIFHQRTEERLYDVDRGPMVDEEIEPTVGGYGLYDVYSVLLDAGDSFVHLDE